MPISIRKSARPKPTSSETTPSKSSLSPKLSALNTHKLTTPLVIFFTITHTVAGPLPSSDCGVEANTTFSAMQTVSFNACVEMLEWLQRHKYLLQRW